MAVGRGSPSTTIILLWVHPLSALSLVSKNADVVMYLYFLQNCSYLSPFVSNMLFRWQMSGPIYLSIDPFKRCSRWCFLAWKWCRSLNKPSECALLAHTLKAPQYHPGTRLDMSKYSRKQNRTGAVTPFVLEGLHCGTHCDCLWIVLQIPLSWEQSC